MKINEAPEKLYLHPTAKGEVGASWLTFQLTNEDIEYVRTDAFIDKAAKWINEHTSLSEKLVIENFVKYMKGE